jgi:hypothetical protein
VLTDANTATSMANALLLSMFAERFAATFMTMPFVSPVTASPRAAAVLASVSYSTVLAPRTLVPDNMRVFLFLDRTVRAAVAPSGGSDCFVGLLLAAARAAGAALGCGRWGGLERQVMRHKAANSCCAISPSRRIAGAATLHMLLALETCQLSCLHVQSGLG